MNNLRQRYTDNILDYVDHSDAIGSSSFRFTYISYLPEPVYKGLELPDRDGAEPGPDVYLTRRLVR